MRLKKKSTSIGVLGKILNAFSNSQKDTYSCNYINKKFQDIYSEEEIKTDKIFLGKPIYRKVVKTHLAINSSSNLQNINIPHNIKDFDSIFSAFMITNSNAIFPYMAYNGGITLITAVDSTNIIIRCKNDTWDRDINIILEYTKTTD